MTENKKMNRKKQYKFLSIPAMIVLMLALCACGTQSHSNMQNGPDFQSIEQTGEWNLEYARLFEIKEYADYHMITIDADRFLVVPENVDVPDNVPPDVVILKKPLNHVYQVSSSIMDMISRLGALDHITLTGTKESDWYLDEIVQRIQSGQLIYAGKYSAPDYELILADGCDLAIENSMIYHNPETKEKLEALGIPVLVELSSYEEHPLGRLEWIKLYGLLFDKEDEAMQFFENQVNKVKPLVSDATERKKVAFFYITSNGAVNVRRTRDAVPKMIEMAGGQYALCDLDEDDSVMSTMNMQMEEFYRQAIDADIIIYNCITVGDVESVADIIDKNSVIKDFKAVKNGEVYTVGGNFYQSTTQVCDFIVELNRILNDDSGKYNQTFIRHIN